MMRMDAPLGDQLLRQVTIYTHIEKPVTMDVAELPPLAVTELHPSETMDGQVDLSAESFFQCRHGRESGRLGQAGPGQKQAVE